MSAVVLMAPSVAHADPGEALHDLVDAAAQRLQSAEPVAAAKWLNGGPITDPVRVEEVLATVARQARSFDLPTDFVTRVFTDQINATEAIQYQRFADWKFDPATAPTWAPALGDLRATIDDLNHRMVAEMASEWPVLHSPGCPGELDAATLEVAASRRLDALHRHALDVATGSYCS